MSSYQEENNVIMSDQQIIHNNVNNYNPQQINYPPPLPMPPNEHQMMMMNPAHFLEVQTHYASPVAVNIKEEGREAYEDRAQHQPNVVPSNFVSQQNPMDNIGPYMEPIHDENDELNESIEEEDEVDEINDADEDDEEIMHDQNAQLVNPSMNGYGNGVASMHGNGLINQFPNQQLSHHPQQQQQQPYAETAQIVEYQQFPDHQQPQHLQPPQYFHQEQQHETNKRHMTNLPPQNIVEESNSPGRLEIDEGNKPSHKKIEDEFSAEEESELDDDELEDGGDLDRKLNKFESMEINNPHMNSVKEPNLQTSNHMDQWMSQIDRNTRTCPICNNNKAMSSMNNVLRHIKEVHGKDNPRLCEQVTEIRHRLARKYTPKQMSDKIPELDDGSADMLKSIYNPETRQCNGCGQTLAPTADWKQHLLEVHKIQPANSNQETYPQDGSIQLQPIPITPISMLHSSNQNTIEPNVAPNVNSRVQQPPLLHNTNPSATSKNEKKPLCHLCNNFIRFDNFTRHLRQKHGCGEEEINKLYADLQMKRIKRKDAPTTGPGGFDIQHKRKTINSPINDERDSQHGPLLYQQQHKQNSINNNYETQRLPNAPPGNFDGDVHTRGNHEGSDFQNGDENTDNVPMSNSMGMSHNGDAVEIGENINWEQDLIKTIRDRKFACPFCVRQVIDRRNLINHIRNVHKKDCSSVERVLGPRLNARPTKSNIKKDDGKFAERVLGPRFAQMQQYPDAQQRPLEPIRISQTMDNDGDSEDSDEREGHGGMMNRNGIATRHKRKIKTRGEDRNTSASQNIITKKLTHLSQNQDPRSGMVQKVFVCPICNTKFKRDPRKIVDHLFDMHGMQPIELIQKNLKIGIRQCRRATGS